jgi:hypothetical protein
MGEKKNAHKILLGKSEWNRLLGSQKCRWENNIKIGIW